ncbi:Lrp/AsnC ligand binding domain-containing protein [Plantactinospora sp. KLBMP9567]|uniref:Lrp/AsnC ligand binding domain-containing protein n=1 Tax=Plantactinospora sp. KLBMP9567 TaxID=3085900 RepID=UPI0029811DE1|nr:Lrp/AsnC ligand binding domain-containing protein [Plantactinospora sp. KLBMP9567]MDW5328313.1 Lrp/AsnC ligand binding domain-containing protein [Plantactinospora sp. KLBMP9567]
MNALVSRQLVRTAALHELLEQRSEILECLRTTGDDCYVMKVAAPSMARVEQIVDELASCGSTTTSLVYSATLPYRGPRRTPPRP